MLSLLPFSPEKVRGCASPRTCPGPLKVKVPCLWRETNRDSSVLQPVAQPRPVPRGVLILRFQLRPLTDWSQRCCCVAVTSTRALRGTHYRVPQHNVCLCVCVCTVGLQSVMATHRVALLRNTLIRRTVEAATEMRHFPLVFGLVIFGTWCLTRLVPLLRYVSSERASKFSWSSLNACCWFVILLENWNRVCLASNDMRSCWWNANTSGSCTCTL